MELSLEGMRLFYEFRSRFDELSESALRWLIGARDRQLHQVSPNRCGDRQKR